MHKNYLSDEEFYTIYNRVPRLSVDLVIKSDEGVLMVTRNIEPDEGDWHLLGGTVYKGERIEEAAIRVAKKETNLDTEFVKCLGYMEFPDEIRRGVNIHTTSIAILLKAVGGEIKPDSDAKELKYFKEIPDNLVPEQKRFLKTLENIFQTSI